MTAISWLSILFYCLFGTFVYYQQLHFVHFRGRSEGFKALLGLSVFAGMITGLGFLAYYGWVVVWWAPILIFTIGLVFTVIGVFLEKALGGYVLSMLGFIGWPICAYLMFHFIPKIG